MLEEGRLEHDIKQNMFLSFYDAPSLPSSSLSIAAFRFGCICNRSYLPTYKIFIFVQMIMEWVAVVMVWCL